MRKGCNLQQRVYLQHMKASLFAKSAALVLVVAAFTGGAQAKPNEPRERQTASGLIVDSDERYVQVTGSNIPQLVKRKSIGTNSAHNVRIFTQRELQTNNGGFGVGGIALDPSVSISGRGR
ncbi:MAG: hypothetical protein H0X73_02540 [Chthoniobacterales bacterium]|nr:hypothetical protein [Chthoniobacterales bacterium]